jgi:hypothetical protein
MTKFDRLVAELKRTGKTTADAHAAAASMIRKGSLQRMIEEAKGKRGGTEVKAVSPGINLSHPRAVYATSSIR